MIWVDALFEWLPWDDKSRVQRGQYYDIMAMGMSRNFITLNNDLNNRIRVDTEEFRKRRGGQYHICVAKNVNFEALILAIKRRIEVWLVGFNVFV